MDGKFKYCVTPGQDISFAYQSDLEVVIWRAKKSKRRTTRRGNQDRRPTDNQVQNEMELMKQKLALQEMKIREMEMQEKIRKLEQANKVAELEKKLMQKELDLTHERKK